MVAYVRHGNTYLIQEPTWRGLRTSGELTHDKLLMASDFVIKGDAEFLRFTGGKIIRSKS